MRPTHIIIHCSDTRDSGTVSWSAIRKYHMKTLGWDDIGYHFGIEKVGYRYEILVGRMMNEAGAHCRENAMNRRSLGICFIGKFDLEPPPLTMFFRGVRLVGSLQEVFGIDRQNVRGHNEFAPHKTCPGVAFHMSEFRSKLVR